MVRTPEDLPRRKQWPPDRKSGRRSGARWPFRFGFTTAAAVHCCCRGLPKPLPTTTFCRRVDGLQTGLGGFWTSSEAWGPPNPKDLRPEIGPTTNVEVSGYDDGRSP